MADFGAGHSARFAEIARWLSSVDPWSDHEAARQLREFDTGGGLLGSDPYRMWKSGLIKHLWLYGAVGCGKTILCSTAIDDTRAHCADANIGHAIFYFSFSNEAKQTYDNLIRSLVVQLGRKEPGLSMLRHAYEWETSLGQDDLHNILLACITSYDEVLLHLDGLDECPEVGGVRQNLLKRLGLLLQRASNVRMLATSREVPEICHHMKKLGAQALLIDAKITGPDIQKYVCTQLSEDRKLTRLDEASRGLIGETVVRKADGMFRWAYCQMQELKKCRTIKPKSVEATLLSLPETLDETYERMLIFNAGQDRSDALTLLRWLAYARSPLSFDELVEITIIDPTDDPNADGIVDVDNRSSWEDLLEILAGFVVIEGAVPRDAVVDVESLNPSNGGEVKLRNSHFQRYGKNAKVKLAHLSVREYLESKRILVSAVKDFQLDPSREHRFIAQSCLVYLTHYSKSPRKTSTTQDLILFPLLAYAASSWFYHSRLQQRGSDIREFLSLFHKNTRLDWLRIYQPDQLWYQPFTTLKNLGPGLYYASVLGLETVAADLLTSGSDVNAQGGMYGNALQAAAVGGHQCVVRLLLNFMADPNQDVGFHRYALCAAAWEGYDKIVQMLVDGGADVNAQRKVFGDALQAACFKGHEALVQVLLNAGAKANAQGGHYGNASQPAARQGHEKVVRLLIDAGADVNARGGVYLTALQAAASRGHEAMVQILMEAGADVNIQGGYYGNALRAASFQHEYGMFRMLTDIGAIDIDNRLDQWVNEDGHAQHRDRLGRSRIHLAAADGCCERVRLAMTEGHDVDKVDNQRRTPLHWAAYFGRANVVAVLLEGGADGNHRDWQGWTAGHIAAFSGQESVLELLAKHDGHAKGYIRDAYPAAAQPINGHCDSCGRVSHTTAAMKTKPPGQEKLKVL